ncbi:sugar-binding domain-containing protein [Chryseolinea soli]|nr:sugar-binding domain-containing protein [Chryseolinea soli]
MKNKKTIAMLGALILSLRRIEKSEKNPILRISRHSSFVLLILLALSLRTFGQPNPANLDLSGPWSFQIDRNDEGVKEKWFTKTLDDRITLPGSMASNGKGDDIAVNTPWTGSIFDSAFYKAPEFAPYRQPGNIKVPFWLQPGKYFKGVAWYQKTITLPASWSDKFVELFIERAHWETTVWIDDVPLGQQNSLAVSHVYALPAKIRPGVHRITVRVDNRVKQIDVGQNSHSISDHTQTNWNGMIGKLQLQAKPLIHIHTVKIFPNLKDRNLRVQVQLINTTHQKTRATLELQARPTASQTSNLKKISKALEVQADSSVVEMEYDMGSAPLLWDEFNPNRYVLAVILSPEKGKADVEEVDFGMREFSSSGTQFTINGRPVFLRGTLECAIFPKTGFPPTDKAAWTDVFVACKSFGLNHVRFHSWCPPESAFDVADSLGVYLQIECSSWANQGSSVGDGKPVDRYIQQESERIVNAYGNHPSFCMMAYGNEPGGDHQVKYLTDFVNHWKQRDNRRQYTTGAGWPVIPENNYNSTPDPRIQHWGEGLKSIINGKAPATNYDWSGIINQWSIPTVSHEIGQWCVFPDLKEIAQYDGVLKARNFEIFEATLKKNHLRHLADSFLLASGKLQALCYKADIEAALRTKNFAGFQLLDLHDFPGQGTALVGVLNPFWKEKGYITAKEYSRFCNAIVPLARFSKMIYLNDEALDVPVEVANFGNAALKDTRSTWEIADRSGKVIFKGEFPKAVIPVGNGIELGRIKQTLNQIVTPSFLTLTVSVGVFQNSWDLFVYPAKQPEATDEILVTDHLDKRAVDALNQGGKVILTARKGSVKPEFGGDIPVGFSSIFWNTAWTHGQPPHTLGILCDPQHPAFALFPTQYHSNWQWWDAMSHSNAILLDAVDPALHPLVRVVDDWVTSRSIGLIFECSVGKGTLIVSGIDLLTGQDQRPEARQLLTSLKNYLHKKSSRPSLAVSPEKIAGIFK